MVLARLRNHQMVIFFYIYTATTEIYTLSLHDALPIFRYGGGIPVGGRDVDPDFAGLMRDRKSTRLNSSHSQISYAVFCLKKKNTTENDHAPSYKCQNTACKDDNYYLCSFNPSRFARWN